MINIQTGTGTPRAATSAKIQQLRADLGVDDVALAAQIGAALAAPGARRTFRGDVASQAAMLALATVNLGDWVRRTDLGNQQWELTTAGPGTLSNWTPTPVGTTGTSRTYRGDVASQAAMLALTTVNVGDWVRRTDLGNQQWELTTAGPSALGNWTVAGSVGSTPVDTPFPTDFAIRYDRDYRNVAAVYTQTGAITFTRNETGAANGNSMQFAILSNGSPISVSALLSAGGAVTGDNLSAPVAGGTYFIAAYRQYDKYGVVAELLGVNVSAPGAPTGLTLGTPTASTQPMSWTAPASNGGASITDYEVQSKLASDPDSAYTTFADGVGTTTAATIASLPASTNLSWRVRAINPAGSGPWSNVATGSTAAAALGQQIILDQDFVTDGGDIGQTTVALMAHMLGYARVIGIIINASASKAPGAWDALRKWYKLPAIPIGVWKGTSKDATNTTWVSALYDMYARDVGLASTLTDSTVQYRTLLAAAADNSIDIVAGGYANTLDALLSSPADGISPLTGAQLIAAKVKMLWWSAGEFPTGSAEWNMRGGSAADATFCAMSDRVVKNWPSPITFGGFVFGQTPAVDGAKLTATKSSADPRRKTYFLFNGGVDNGGWDNQISISALDQTGLAFVKGANSGVNTTTGVNTWVDNPAGKDRYQTKTNSATWYKDRIEALSCLDPSSTLPSPNWGTSSAIVPAVPWSPVLPPLGTPNAGEKLTNSTFNNNSLTGWAAANGTLEAANGRMVVLPTASYPLAYQSFATTVGQTYTVTAQLDFMEQTIGTAGNEVSFYMKNGAAYTDAANNTLSGTFKRLSPGLYSFTFVAATTTTTLMVIQDGGNQRSYAFDHISVV